MVGLVMVMVVVVGVTDDLVRHPECLVTGEDEGGWVCVLLCVGGKEEQLDKVCLCV